nr:CHAT domain-containing protein [Methylomonas koyamae]
MTPDRNPTGRNQPEFLPLGQPPGANRRRRPNSRIAAGRHSLAAIRLSRRRPVGLGHRQPRPAGGGAATVQRQAIGLISPRLPYGLRTPWRLPAIRRATQRTAAKTVCGGAGRAQPTADCPLRHDPRPAVPCSALARPAADRQPPRVLSASASILQFLAQPGNSPKAEAAVLAVGNPSNMAYQAPFAETATAQPALPAAATEAAYIASLFDKSQELIGPEATLAAVRQALPDCNVLHFATHGILAETAPLLSSILLADGAALTVQDLIGLRLNADLVVLSACRTGQGKTAGGDDVLGFSRGLLAAGARAAIVSLWPVDDLATSLLMAEFYRQLKAGAAPGLALQAAQNYLQALEPEAIKTGRLKALSSRGVSVDSDAAPADYRHPYYWAPFVLVG